MAVSNPEAERNRAFGVFSAAFQLTVVVVVRARAPRGRDGAGRRRVVTSPAGLGPSQVVQALEVRKLGRRRLGWTVERR
jgi:hypothetical protein